MWWEEVDRDFPLDFQDMSTGNPSGSSNSNNNEKADTFTERQSRPGTETETSADEAPNQNKKNKRRTTAQKNAAKRKRQGEQGQGYPLRSKKAAGGHGTPKPPSRPPPTRAATPTPSAGPSADNPDSAGVEPEQLAQAIEGALPQASSPRDMASVIARLDEFNPTVAQPPKARRTPGLLTIERLKSRTMTGPHFGTTFKTWPRS